MLKLLNCIPADVAYFANKHSRGFKQMIYVLGAFTLALFLIAGAVLFVSEKLARPIGKLREGVGHGSGD